MNKIKMRVLVEVLAAIKAVRQYDDHAAHPLPHALWDKLMSADVELTTAMKSMEDAEATA